MRPKITKPTSSGCIMCGRAPNRSLASFLCSLMQQASASPSMWQCYESSRLSLKRQGDAGALPSRSGNPGPRPVLRRPARMRAPSAVRQASLTASMRKTGGAGGKTLGSVRKRVTEDAVLRLLRGLPRGGCLAHLCAAAGARERGIEPENHEGNLSLMRRKEFRPCIFRGFKNLCQSSCAFLGKVCGE